MTRTASRPRKTVEDLLALPEEVRAELIGGEIYVNPAPFPEHQRICRRLSRWLEDWAEPRGAGEVFFAPLDVHLPSGDVVEPDVILIAKANRAIFRDCIRGIPDLLIEIVSTTHPERDRIVKRDLYARNGVPEYWIVEPGDQAIEVLRLAAGVYAAAGYFETGTLLTSASMPGFALAVTELFAPLS